jgi:hypothetical protein
VAEALVEFEEVCMRKTYVTEVPGDIRDQMTSLAQEMAEFIASKADQEAINKMLKASPGEIQYTDEEIEDRRVNLLFTWMRKVSNIVEKDRKKPNVIRGEAREKIFKKMSDAIDMAMSKHDQVLITGHSRLGRVQLPTCIACDRPLAAKKRFRDMDGEEGAQQVPAKPLHNGGKSLKLPGYKEIDSVPHISMMEGSRPETAGQIREYGGGGELVRRPGTAGATGPARPIFGGGPAGKANQFVYRGGFKMPKGGPSAMVVTGMMGPDALPHLPGGGGGRMF